MRSSYSTAFALYRFSHLHLILTIILCLCLFSGAAHGHSFLLHPRAAVRGFTPDGCVGNRCRACPPLFKNPNYMNNSKDSPEVTWRRGQRIMIRWAKNNHRGGFVRFSIVPVQRMMEVRVHDQLSFYYGCWEQGLHSCAGHPGRDCGADMSNVALRRVVTVPDYLPDGVYVFGFLWFGGLHFNGRRSQFADYPSCSFIRVKGGKKLSYKGFDPEFKPGRRGLEDRVRTSQTCETYVDRPRECTKPSPGCEGKRVFRALPKAFQNDKHPKKIYAKFFLQVAARQRKKQQQQQKQASWTKRNTQPIQIE